MMNVYVRTICDFISAITLICFMNKRMPPKYEKYSKLYSVLMSIFYICISVNPKNNVFFNLVGNKVYIYIFIYYFLALIYPVMFRKGRLSEKFFLASLYITTMLISSFISFTIFSYIFNTTLGEVAAYGSSLNLLVLINRFLHLMFTFVFFNKVTFIKYIRNKTLCAGGVILILNQLVIFMIEKELIEKLGKVDIYIMTVGFSLCSIQVLSIYILSMFAKETEENFMLRMNLKRKVHDREIIDMYTKMIGWKHDFRNHINMILGFLEVGTKDEAISYINEIDSSISKLDKNIYTDDMAVNSILVTKIKTMEDNDINISLDLRINMEIEISNVDICVILGNLLDNSIEACSNIEGYKFINLRIVSESNKLVIKISNSTDGCINEFNGRFISTKDGMMHGIGLTQVDGVVKKYNGYINRRHEKNIFTTYVMIQY